MASGRVPKTTITSAGLAGVDFVLSIRTPAKVAF
jgi:hypothetical protein